MTTNEVRWFLHNFHKNKIEIDKLKSELEEYRKMDGVKAQIISDMPMCRSGESKQESVIFKAYYKKGTEFDTIIDYIHALELELHRLMMVNRAIESVYVYLKEPARSIIEMRYFILPKPNDVRQRKFNWMEISKEIEVKESNCRKIDERVVRKISIKLHGG